MNNCEYIHVEVPDRLKLSELLQLAKGENRTMAEFAEACGISPATLSRILNGKIKRPLSQKTIETIYANRDQDNELSLNALFRANGMISVDENIRRTERETKFHERGLAIEKRRRNMKNIISSELVLRGLPVQRAGMADMDVETVRSIGHLYARATVCDLAVDIPFEGKTLNWGFFAIPAQVYDGEGENSRRFSLTRIIQNKSIIFLEDAWLTEEINTKQKISFVFSDKWYYEAFLASMRFAKIKGRMSVILVSIEEEKVLEETAISSLEKECCEEVFKIPIADNEQGDDDELSYYSSFEEENNYAQSIQGEE